MSRRRSTLILSVGLWAWCIALVGGAWAQSSCDSLRDAWAAEYEKLAAQVAEYSDLRKGLDTEAVRRTREADGLSMAEAVEKIVAERERRSAALATEIRTNLENESARFAEWKRCLRKESRGWKAALRKDPTAAERSDLRDRLKDVLVDEAFLQYRNVAPRSASDYYERSRNYGTQGAYPYGYYGGPTGPVRRGYPGGPGPYNPYYR